MQIIQKTTSMYWIIYFISEFLSTFKVVSTKQITLSQCVWIMSLGYYYIGKPSLQLFVFCINKIKVISYWLFNMLRKPLIEKKNWQITITNQTTLSMSIWNTKTRMFSWLTNWFKYTFHTDHFKNVQPLTSIFYILS